MSTYSPVRHLCFLAAHRNLESYIAPSLPVVSHPLIFPRHFVVCWWQCRCCRLQAHLSTGSFLQLKAGGGGRKVILAQCWGTGDSQAAVPVFLALTGNEISFLSVSPVSNCHNNPWICVVHILPQTQGRYFNACMSLEK